jgi:PAS domain S-box-containing protein
VGVVLVGVLAGTATVAEARQGELAATAAAAGRTADITLWLVIGLSAIAFLVTAGAAVLAVAVVRPLASLRASARAISAGDPGVRARLSAPEQVASLARDFNAMTDALSAQTQEFIDTANLTGVLILRVDKDNRVSLVNDAMCEFLGRSREEILGTPILDYLHAEDALSTIRAIRKMVLSKGLVTGIVSRHVTPMGTRVIEWNGYPIFDEDGRYAGVHGAGRDISEHWRAQEALRESEQRFRTLSEATFEGVALHKKGRILVANQTLAEMFGCQLSEVVGMRPVDFVAPGSRDLVLYATRSGYEEPFELIGLRKDRSTFPIEARGKTTRYQGRTVGVATIRDLSKRKRAEEALQKARDELEGRVERRMRQVNGYGLTFRELAVLHLVVAGESDKEIAAVLGISTLTASKHLANILRKMGAASRTEAGVRALREGLLD